MLFSFLRAACLALLAFPLFVQAQDQPSFQQASCEGVQCQKAIIASPESNFTFVPPPAGFEQGGERDVVISVTYNGFTPEALNAFQYAVDIWASVLTSTVPIEIDAYWEDIPGSVLGYAGASTYYSSLGGGPDADAYYPVALANKIVGFDLYTGPDVDAHFDSSTNWYFGTDGNPGFGQYDFVSVVLHELGHGLGVIGSASVESNLGYLGLGDDYVIWDTFVVNGNGTDITTYTSGTTTLASQLQGNNLFWSGASAVANNGGIQPKLYAPSPFESGSSFSHLDESTYFPGSGNSLMTPQIGAAEAIHDPGPIVMGIMNDIGWDTEDIVIEDCELNIATVEITTDCWGSETTWEVLDGSNNVVFSGGPYPDSAPFGSGTFVTELCLESGCYTFNIYDAFGDGMAGAQYDGCDVDGFYGIYDEFGFPLVTMGAADFGDSMTHAFCIGSDCSAVGLDLYQEDCTADETTLYPTIGMIFEIDGDCTVSELCYQVNGGGFECFDLPSLDIIVGDGDPLFLNQTEPNSTYQFYYTLSSGDVSQTFTFTNGNCDNEEIICDCDGNQLSIGVLAWLGDGFLDDGTYVWAGQTVNFNCATWGYDCGDGGINDDPNGVCNGNLPPNNGCSGEILGCTDPLAVNYNPDATLDDGSCVYDGDIPGCTDPSACNYDPSATVDDGSCLLPLSLEITTDCWGSEVTWQLTDETNTILYSGGPYPDSAPNGSGTFVSDFCLEPGCYTFSIFDSYGDGMAGAQYSECNVDGFYAIYDAFGSAVVSMTNADYGTGTSHNFCFGEECEPTGLDLYQEDCTADETTLYPTIGMFFEIDGPCTVQEICFSENGGAFECVDLPSIDIIMGDGDQLFLNNTTANATYEFYYTLTNGEISDIFTFENGDCENEETICDCDGNQHTIGVLGWLGDGFLDDGTYVWAGQTVNFYCSTWGYDCGDGGINDDPNGVCNGNLPPNNGCVGEILGCTDPEATNYDPSATVNDGSCIYNEDILGCTDASACNYNPDATVNDGSCDYSCYGCTEPGACNYDPDATINNGSCDYSCLGCTDSTACNYDPDATIDNGSCSFTCYGCTNPDACNYDPDATIDNGSCSFNCFGCTDDTACNYNPEAIFDNGSCTYDCYGCTDPFALNYDPDATIDDGSCEYLGVPGCMDVNACNYDPEATIDNGTCDYSCLGCTDEEACNYDPEATIDDGSCDYSCYGCTDDEACNYDPEATIDDDSCDFSCYGCTDDEACNYDDEATIDDGSCEYETCLGCTDPDAVNYDPTATIDDGSCIYDCEYPSISWEFEGCDDGDDGFFVVMVVSSLGNGAPYTVGNNQNGDEITLNFNGTIQLGPFDDGDQVVIDITSVELSGCFLTSPILECPNGVEEGLLREESVFPVPTTNQFFIQAGTNSLDSRAALFDATGKLIWSDRILIAPGQSRAVDVQTFAPGMYQLIIYDEFGKSNHRIIIE